MDRAKLMEELKSCTKDDLELIESSQQDLYTPEEMNVIREMIRVKAKEEKEEQNAFIQAHLPKDITCPKCEGVNPFSNDICCYCGYAFDKSKYYQIDYYNDDNDEINNNEEKDNGRSYTFQYIISFLIPLVGFILGAILLSKDNDEEKSVGKTCIVLGIIAIAISAIIYALIL